jgi:hypothetical protein
MPEYRIYRMSPDGHIKGPAETVECADDGEAFERAQQAVDIPPMQRGCVFADPTTTD